MQQRYMLHEAPRPIRGKPTGAAVLLRPAYAFRGMGQPDHRSQIATAGLEILDAEGAEIDRGSPYQSTCK